MDVLADVAPDPPSPSDLAPTVAAGATTWIIIAVAVVVVVIGLVIGIIVARHRRK